MESKIIAAAEILVVIALPEEAQGVFDPTGARLCYSGIGKVNATYAVTRAIIESRPRLVINFGTAGSPLFRMHELVECTSFVQRDIDLSPLGFIKGMTPYDETPAVLTTPKRLLSLADGICGTGDNFETSLGPAADGFGPVQSPEAHLPRANVIEMEAYAVAKVCWREQIPFACVKYITDGSDSNATSDWVSNLPRAAAAFRAVFDQLREA